MAKQIAIALLVASLALLIIYGADVMIASQSNSAERMGFLPFNESVRGGVFGGGAVVMSIIAFVIARKEYAPAVSVLLFVNGGLIIAGMVALIGQGALNSADPSGATRTIGSTIGLGAILVGLGAWKAIRDKKIIAAKGKEPTQN